MRFKFLILTAVFLGLVSCDSPRKEVKPEAIARVGNAYLYRSDIVGLIPENSSKEDSTLIVKTYIERWAAQKLLTEVSELNLDSKQKKEFEQLVEKYKTDLYTNAYLEQLVKTRVDTAVTKEELKQYYEENKTNFRTNGQLVKLRYIKAPLEHQKLKEIKERFFNPKKSDKSFWDTYMVQLNSVALNDSVWVDMNQIYQRISFITPDNADQYIQSGKNYEYKEGESIYYVKIKSVLPTNEISPFEYIEPTVKQVILNKRKLDFIKQIEKEITEDAIKNNKYEIYE